ncbi:uncharacterized protein EV420DRAFT_691558 [Desarmillaria tabescens]|uniref:DUF7770 domain-containing protein n=1 Tax=Armillaria tabescens TaxID=1929756 RepID=A0AA39MZY8_ARMTA|nr:uncharacterized protein EV420DRAFT_691558 [Desarmillaria tabescens]KAK0452090.1 hypothetical protein EV420DRAFT_691558 [Desarmillaria tabescens]
MSYALPNRASISSTSELRLQLNTFEVDGVALVGISNGHTYHFQVFIYNRALDCSVSLNCNPSYDFRDPDQARVDIDFKTSAYTQFEDITPGRIPPSTGLFDVSLKASTQVWKIFNVLFDTLKRDQYRFNSGLGCRHWCATILSDLETHGYVSPGDTMKFEIWEGAKHAEFGAAVFFLPRIQGDFFDRALPIDLNLHPT